MEEIERRPLLAGRGFVEVERLCLSAGLDEGAVRSLILAGRLDGLCDSRGRAFALFDDTLPDAETWSALGLSVRGDYDPEEFRSEEDDGNDDDDADAEHDHGPDWTITW